MSKQDSENLFSQRQEEIADIWKTNRWLYFILGYGLGLLSITFFRMLFTEPSNLFEGLIPEAIGLAITYLIIDRSIRAFDKSEKTRQEQRERDRYQKQYYINLLRAQTPEEKSALLLEMDALEILEGANLGNLNLDHIDVGRLPPGIMTDPVATIVPHKGPGRINMRGVILHGATLRGANLQSADLREAGLYHATLYNANLSYADLENTNFLTADVSEANLEFAKLKNARCNRGSFSKANLSFADLEGFEPYRTSLWGATMPDGTINESESEKQYYENIRRFTDPKSNDYWRPQKHVWWLKDND